MLVQVALPQRQAKSAAKVEARALLRQFHERFQVGAFFKALGHYVHVIRHEAVRWNCELLLLRDARDLLEHNLNVLR